MEKIIEKPEECDFCGYETEDLHYAEGIAGQKEGWLCNLCYSTQCGNVFLYPTQYDYESHTILKALAQCTHLILDAIEKNNASHK